MSICPARPIRPQGERHDPRRTPDARRAFRARQRDRLDAARRGKAKLSINGAVRAAPFAPYVLAQTVLVQQQTLEAAARRVAELEAAHGKDAEQPEEHGSFLGNLGKTIFGGGAPAAPQRPGYDQSAYQRAPAPPPPQGYAPPPPPQGYPPPPPPQGYPQQPGPVGRSCAATERRLPAERRFNRGGRCWRRCPRQSPGRPVRRPWRRPVRRIRNWGAGFGGAGLGGNPAEVTEINNFYDDKPDHGGSDAAQFDPGVQDASFDNQDDFGLRRLFVG